MFVGILRGQDESYIQVASFILSTCEVSVVAGHDGVLLPLGHVLPVPLTDAGAASVGEDDAAKLSHCVGEAVPLDGGPDLLTAGGDVEGALGLEALGKGLLHQRGDPAHVFVAGVGAGPDETILNLERPLVLLGGIRQLGDGGGEVRGKRAIDVRLQSAQVNLDNLEMKGKDQIAI